MSRLSRENALDHVVVVMFENRSFDNLLGRLYEPGEVTSFEGVIGKDLSNPVPAWAEHGPADGIVRYRVSPDTNTPNPDPGGEWPHVNTQLFGILDEENRGGVPVGEVVQRTAPRPNADNGRVRRGLHQHAHGRAWAPADGQEYAQIMTGYAPEQMPVLSGIARALRHSTIGSATCRPAPTPTGRSFTPGRPRVLWST